MGHWVADENAYLDGLLVKSFWGGNVRGRCLQFTPQGDYAQLDYWQVYKLRRMLSRWLKEGREGAQE